MIGIPRKHTWDHSLKHTLVTYTTHANSLALTNNNEIKEIIGILEETSVSVN